MHPFQTGGYTINQFRISTSPKLVVPAYNVKYHYNIYIYNRTCCYASWKEMQNMFTGILHQFVGYSVATWKKNESKKKRIIYGTGTHVVFPCRRHRNKGVKQKFEKDGKVEIINCGVVRSLIKKGNGTYKVQVQIMQLQQGIVLYLLFPFFNLSFFLDHQHPFCFQQDN